MKHRSTALVRLLIALCLLASFALSRFSFVGDESSVDVANTIAQRILECELGQLPQASVERSLDIFGITHIYTYSDANGYSRLEGQFEDRELRIGVRSDFFVLPWRQEFISVISISGEFSE